MFMIRRIGMLAIVIAAVFALNGVAVADTVVFKIGQVENPGSHSGVGAEAFAKEVARLSGGQMQVKVFHGGKLGNIPVQIANVNNGSQDMHLIYPEALASYVPEAKVIPLPYVFTSLEHAQKFFKSELWKPANEVIESEGAVLLDKTWSWWVNDPRGFISVRPVFSPADMKGLKMRIWEAKGAIATWQGFGANTMVVPRAEMYLAFKQGMIEAGPEVIGTAYAQKTVEMAKYWHLTAEYRQIINVMMNKDKYATLSSEQKDILQQAMISAGKIFAEVSRKNFETKKVKANLEYGVNYIEPAIKPWREAGAATVAKLVKEGFVSKEFIEKIRALDK